MDSGGQKPQVYRMKHPKKSFHIMAESAFYSIMQNGLHRHAINRSIKNDISSISFSFRFIVFITFLKGQFHSIFIDPKLTGCQQSISRRFLLNLILFSLSKVLYVFLKKLHTCKSVNKIRPENNHPDLFVILWSVAYTVMEGFLRKKHNCFVLLQFAPYNLNILSLHRLIFSKFIVFRHVHKFFFT
jgi:hypothetical protein